MSIIAFKRLTQCLAAVLIAALPAVSILSDEGDNEEKGNAADTTLTETTQQIQDSVYTQINKDYQSVRHIFENSCFDCHSTFTKYPWYYKLPGIKGLIDDDIKEASKQMDLSNDFPFGGKYPSTEILKDIKEEIENDDMPLFSYRMMHWGKLIEDKRRDSVFQWIDKSMELLKQNKKGQ